MIGLENGEISIQEHQREIEIELDNLIKNRRKRRSLNEKIRSIVESKTVLYRLKKGGKEI